MVYVKTAAAILLADLRKRVHWLMIEGNYDTDVGLIVCVSGWGFSHLRKIPGFCSVYLAMCYLEY